MSLRTTINRNNLFIKNKTHEIELDNALAEEFYQEQIKNIMIKKEMIKNVEIKDEMNIELAKVSKEMIEKAVENHNAISVFGLAITKEEPPNVDIMA